MRGYFLRIQIFKYLAFLLTTFLTFFTVASWSQNAEPENDRYYPLLTMALIVISLIFEELKSNHSEKEESVHTWAATELRFRFWCQYIQWSFLAIAFFPLGSKIWPDLLHFVSTGSAVGGIFFFATGYFKMWTKNWWRVNLPLLVFTVALIVAFVFKEKVFWTVGHAEFGLMLTGLLFVTLIKK